MLRPNLLKLSKSVFTLPTNIAFSPIRIVSNQSKALFQPIRFYTPTPQSPYLRKFATKSEGSLKHDRYQLARDKSRHETKEDPQKEKDHVVAAENASDKPKSVRKPVWKKKKGVKDILFPETAESEEELLKVNAYCTAEYYDFDKLYAYLAKISPRTTRTTSSYEVIYRPYGINESAHVFYFEGGSMVAWGTTAKENQELLRELKQFEQNPVEEVQTETMNWALSDKETTTLDKDTVLISKELNERDQVAHKLAFSYGLHQSVKLEVHENIAEALFQSMKDTPELLLQRDFSLFSLARRRDVRKKYSALLKLRADINLYSELLEIPDIFWDEHHLEINYKKIAKHLVIESRTSIVNKKIDYSDQLNKALRQQLAEDYGVRLEWLIIILIAIEVVQGLYLIWSEWTDKEEETAHP